MRRTSGPTAKVAYSVSSRYEARWLARNLSRRPHRSPDLDDLSRCGSSPNHASFHDARAVPPRAVLCCYLLFVVDALTHFGRANERQKQPRAWSKRSHVRPTTMVKLMIQCPTGSFLDDPNDGVRQLFLPCRRHYCPIHRRCITVKML
jgi:hypothetical protein